MVRLTVEKGEAAGAVFELKAGEHTLGRSRASAVHLAAPDVSGVHACIRVSADGTGGRLTLPDGFSLANLTVGVANPEALDAHKAYPILSWSGTLAGTFGASALPGPWYVYYDRDNRSAELRAAIGTLILMH